ncbi:MAG: aromatic ring-hydroxylating oxygenase subunit alpha [Novosphingobium sp.]
MSAHPDVAQWLALDQAGRSLPQGLYISEAAFAFDTQVMLKSVWLFACTVAHVKKPGDFYLFEMANASVIIVRGRDGEVRAFHNSCAHRGAKICSAASGSGPRFTCPYHQWSYGLDGRLLAARNMPEGFEKAANGLKPVALENVAGMIFICLGDNPPPIGRAKPEIAEQVSLYNLDRLKVAVQEDMVHQANWKLVMENNRECYHCDSNHPELNKTFVPYGFDNDMPVDSACDSEEGAYIASQIARWKDLGIYHDLIEFPEGGWHRVSRLPMAKGTYAATLDGQPASRLPIWSLAEPDSSSLSVHTQPNSWHHFFCDHAVTFSLTPISPDRTLLRTSWLVHEDAVEGEDYDPENLTAVWRATNHQDGHLAEINHAGIATDGYSQGYYSLDEGMVEAFKDFYVSRARAALNASESTSA